MAEEIMIQQYEQNKVATIGSEIACPCCLLVFRKKTKDQAFCSNGRTEGAGNCKDAYWNKVDPNKRNRKHPKSHYRKYNVGEKSAENRLHYEDDDWYNEHPFSADGLGQWMD